MVKGAVWYDTVKGDKRNYLFEVTWSQNLPEVKVSCGDPSNRSDFENRAAHGFRPVEGLRKGHRPDLRDFVKRIATHERGRVLNEETWLHEQFDNFATRIDVSDFSLKKLGVSRDFALLRGWLLIKLTTVRGSEVSATRLHAGATLTEARIFIAEKFGERR
jgi:hypothetical protein